MIENIWFVFFFCVFIFGIIWRLFIEKEGFKKSERLFVFRFSQIDRNILIDKNIFIYLIGLIYAVVRFEGLERIVLVALGLFLLKLFFRLEKCS